MPDLHVGLIKRVAGRRLMTRQEHGAGGMRFGTRPTRVIEPLTSSEGVPLFRAGVHGFDDTEWRLWGGS